MCVCVCVHVCVLACVPVCVFTCTLRVRVCVCVRLCVRVCGLRLCICLRLRVGLCSEDAPYRLCPLSPPHHPPATSSKHCESMSLTSESPVRRTCARIFENLKSRLHILEFVDLPNEHLQ